MTTKEYRTSSPEETEALAAALGARALASGRRQLFIAMFGEMGVGKTAFTRGFASGVAPSALVRSPTYTVVNEYRGGAIPIFHFDMYRIEDGDDLTSIGFSDYLASDGFILCEWSENIVEDLPSDALHATILRDGDGTGRRIILKGEGYEDIMP